jgi:enterochelin esterase-like enzyme
MTRTVPFVAPRTLPLASRLALPATAALVAVGLLGVYRYLDNYWLYRGFSAPRDPAYVVSEGTQQTIAVRSPALGGRSQPVIVYLPPGYSASSQRRYPVFYLLHGSPGVPLDFVETVRIGVVEDELVALHEAQPLILVMPFGSTGHFTDKEWANGVGRNQGWETFVARDLVRAVDARYRTIAKASARAIGGLSEGGYGAVNIALHHPSEFGVVESWSGYMRADNIGAIFGHRRSLLRRNTPLVTLAAATAALRRAHTYFWFYSGSDDKFRRQNAAFARGLEAHRIPHRFFLVGGGHNWALWRGNAVRSYLAAARRLSDA